MLCKDESDAVAELRYREKVWKWERAGWVFMGLFLVAGLAEVLGSGPRSRQLVKQGSFLQLVKGTPSAGSPIRLEIQAKAGPEKDLVLRIRTAYLEETKVQRIVPAPSHMISARDWSYYVFPAAVPNQSVTAVFHLKRNGAENAPMDLGVTEGELLSFNQVEHR